MVVRGTQDVEKRTLCFQRCAKRTVEHDAPIARYYERLATVQSRGSQASHQVLSVPALPSLTPRAHCQASHEVLYRPVVH